VKVEQLTLGDLLTLDQIAVRVDPSATYRSAGVLNRGRGLFRKPDLLGSDTSYSTLYRLHAGQVIYSRLFGWEGAVTTVDAEFDGCHVSSEFPTLASDASRVSTAYLDHYLKSPTLAALIAKAGSGLGQRRQRVSVGSFLGLPIPLPSREDQDRIAAHFDSLARAGERAAVSSEDAQALYASLRERVFANFDAADYRPLGTVLTSVDQTEEVSPETAYPTIGVRARGRGAFDSGQTLGSETSYKRLRRFSAGQVCYPKLMGWQGAFTVIPAELDGYFASPEFVAFDVDRASASERYLDHIFRWSNFVNAAAERATGTNANRRRLQPADFLGLKVPLPPIETQHRIARWLDLATGVVSKAVDASQLASAVLPAARNKVFAALTRGNTP